MSEHRMTVGGSADITGITSPAGEKYIRVEDMAKVIDAVRADAKQHNWNGAEVSTLIKSQLPQMLSYTPAEILAGMWVPVTPETRPDEKDDVLCMNEHDYQMVGHLAWNDFLHCYCCETPCDTFIRITHWMPLPRLPKEARL